MAENNLTPFKRVEVAGEDGGGPDLAEVVRVLQVNLEMCLQFITEVPILDGRLVTVSMGAGTDTTILHKLERTPRGWFLTRKFVTGNVPKEVSRDSSKLVLQSASADTIDIWVF